MEQQGHDWEHDAFYTNLDPALWNTPGATLQTGSQFEGQPIFDAEYLQQDAGCDDVAMDLGPGGPGDQNVPSLLSQQQQGHPVTGPMHAQHCIDHYDNYTQTQEMHDTRQWPLQTPFQSHVQEHMLDTPPASSHSPNSQPQRHISMPTIQFSPAQQALPALSLDTDQPLQYHQPNTPQGSAMLSPMSAYNTPVSQTSWQSLEDRMREVQTPSRRTRPRAKSAVGFGTSDLVYQMFADQADAPLDIPTWQQGNVNHTDQPGPSRRTRRQQHPPALMHSVSAPASVASYSCPSEGCDREFPTKSDLVHHKRYHDRPEKTCGECGQAFHFPKDLRRHILSVHSDVARFVCEVVECRRAFKRKDHCKRHKLTKHGRVFGGLQAEGL